MALISPEDLVKVYGAYSAARQQAIQSATTPGSTAAAVAAAQHRALLQYFQAQAQLLTNSKTQAAADYDAEIAKCQQKITEVQQLLVADAALNNPPANPAPGPGPAPVPAAGAGPAPPPAPAPEPTPASPATPKRTKSS